MRLKKWLDREERRESWLARRLGVTRSAVNHWTAGISRPSAVNLAQIERLTAGEVTAVDFEPEEVIE